MPALPPVIQVNAEHLVSTPWVVKPDVLAGVEVATAKVSFTAFDTVRLVIEIADVAPSTVASVFAWNARDAADAASPMRCVNEMAVKMLRYGTVATPDTATIAKLIEARGKAKWEGDQKTLQWTVADTHPAPHADEELWHVIGNAPMPLVKARDFVIRAHPPMLLSAEQAGKFNLKPGTWASGCLPSGAVPKSSGLERGIRHRFGVFCEPTDDSATGTKLTLSMAIDMCGSIPAMMMNAAVSKMAEMANRTAAQARRIKKDNGGKDVTPEEFVTAKNK